MYALRNRLLAVAAALTLGALLAPRPADASIPVAVSHPQFTQSAAPTLPASYVLVSIAPDGSCRVEFCRNDPVNVTDPTGLSDMLIGGEVELTTGKWSEKGYHEAPQAADLYHSLSGPEKGFLWWPSPTMRVALGANATVEGVLRNLYDLADKRIELQARELIQRGILTEKAASDWRVLRTNQLKVEARARQTPLGQAISEFLQPSERLPTPDGLRGKQVARGITDPHQINERLLTRVTRPSVTRSARILRVGGTALLIAGIAVDIADVAFTPEEERARKTAGKLGAWSGSLSCGYVGARGLGQLGARTGNPYIAVGSAVVGFVGGTVVGSELGETAGENYYDSFVDE